MAGEKLPLLKAYPFAAMNGLRREAEAIRTRSMPRRGKKSSTAIRRPLMARLLRKHNVLDKFVKAHWPFRLTAAGRSAIARYLAEDEPS